MRLAYLCNVYPAVSHSFVRREIEAVERAGHFVSRFSIRRAHRDVRDSADVRELAATSAILSQGWLRLLGATFRMLLNNPIGGLSAVEAAWKLSGPTLRQKARSIAYFVEGAWLARRLINMNIEHLHAHFGTNPATVAAISHAWGGPPFSFTVHGPDEFDAPVELRIKEKVAASSFVAAISNYGQSQLMRWVAENDWHKIKQVRCGVDQDFLAVRPTAIPDKSIELVTVARLSQQKGLPLLIEACALLRDAGIRFRLTVVGYGELRESLLMRIHGLGLDDSVVFAGIRTSEEIRTLLLSARALVLPSFAEGLPVVIMEALALARPVVTTSIAGIPELVNEECGWVVPAGSVPALTQAMSEVLQAKPDDLFAKGVIGRERVLEMHDVDRNASSLLIAIDQSRSAICTR